MEGGLKLENAAHKTLSQILWSSHGAISLSRSIIKIVFAFILEFRKNETFYLFLSISFLIRCFRSFFKKYTIPFLKNNIQSIIICFKSFC